MAFWQVERRGGIAIARYLNPPMNYMTAEGMQELREIIETWRAPDVRAVILTGGLPNRFITHYSVEELLQSARNRPLMMNMGRAWLHHHNATLTNLRDLPKPVIAAMSGSTMGGGFETSLSCDIRIAQKGDFRYGLPEVTLGILPGGCGTQRLSRLIGAGRAIDFILRGRICKPEEALALGPGGVTFLIRLLLPLVAQILLTAVPSRADNQITNNYEIALNQWVVDALVAQILLVRADNQITNNYEIALNQWVVCRCPCRSNPPHCSSFSS